MPPLVSITIPTKDSADVLAPMLESIQSQTYPNIETIVVDTHSKDGTLEFASSWGAKVVPTDYGMLGARYVGVREARGEVVVLLDADQRLMRDDVVGRLVDAMQHHEMLVLEEKSLNPSTWVQRLIAADRELLHALFDGHVGPMDSALSPRAYDRELLFSAMQHIPEQLYQYAAGFEDAIIYYEAYRLSQNVGLLEDALYHVEPRGILELWRKSFHYGSTTRRMVSSGYYVDLVRRKLRLRRSEPSMWGLAMRSHLLLMLKAPAFALGYLLG